MSSKRRKAMLLYSDENNGLFFCIFSFKVSQLRMIYNDPDWYTKKK
jgi:hypothetical protein